MLKERAESVTILVGVNGVADEVEDLRDASPDDLDRVRLIAGEPHVEVHLGVVPYVSASDSQEARELARDVHSLVSVRRRPGWQSLAAVWTVRAFGFGPGLTFLAILLADGIGLISPSDHTRGVIGAVMYPAVLLGLVTAAIAYKQWLKVDYATPVLPERRREIQSRTEQGRSGTKWGLVSGIALTFVGCLVALLSAWLTDFFGLKA
ncbi:hypothetical protein [Streptomyces guryensis]|uniref:Uncharacterized protein n=1 Tax=Streptomyces guryensis TaxID=2886947 RepID=A0A9Q3VWI1_9ACTN|nr:hypothetical protein [Streptomyces guryensis]MCD9878245.1 hypothetical protein [Streptomyces guryensis]